ncbi:hypothetical protein EDD22DRAFT_1011623 [Suillus occidentalis]|nr:hypothetical protein EDD22DRAFT_1011623 [Suillus occidentalis]
MHQTLSHQRKKIFKSLPLPVGTYVPINIDSQRHWISAIGILSSEESVVWGDTATLSSDASPVLSVEIWASYEADRMLGSGEVIGEFEMSWDELLNHGDGPLGLRRSGRRTADFLIDCEITRLTDAGHAQFAKYMRSMTVSHLNAAVEHFQLVLDQCPASHPDHAAALTNLALARIEGYIRNDLQDIDTTISLFRDALALCPQRHPDRPLSLYILALALSWRHKQENTAVDIREAAQLYHELLPLCAEGTYLRGIAAGKNGVDRCDR